jgi:lipopolysaccharide export system permease protein
MMLKPSLSAGPGYLQPLTGALNEFQKNARKKVLDRSLQIYLLEYYKKFSIPFACFAFICFAFPVGMFTKRSGRSVGFGIGLFVTIIFWGILFAGQTMGIRMYFPPFLSMWLPDILILSVGAVLAFLRFRR